MVVSRQLDTDSSELKQTTTWELILQTRPVGELLQCTRTPSSSCEASQYLQNKTNYQPAELVEAAGVWTSAYLLIPKKQADKINSESFVRVSFRFGFIAAPTKLCVCVIWQRGRRESNHPQRFY